jgi:hypothetical protein
LRGVGEGRRCRCSCRGQEETAAVNVPLFHGCGDCSRLGVRNWLQPSTSDERFVAASFAMLQFASAPLIG